MSMFQAATAARRVKTRRLSIGKRAALRLPDEEAQARFDLELHRIAPVLGLVGAFFAVKSLQEDLQNVPWPGVVPVTVLAALIGVGYLTFAAINWLSHRGLKSANRFATILFLAGAVHGVLCLQLASDKRAFGAIALLLAVCGYALTRVTSYLLVAIIALAGALPEVRHYNPADQSDIYGIVIGAALGGLTLQIARGKILREIEGLEQNDRRLNRQLRATIVDLDQESRQRQASVAELRASEDRYRTMFDNSIVGAFHCTADGDLILANKTLADMLGYESAEEMTNRSLADHFPAAASGGHERAFRRAFEESRLKGGECLLVRRDGSPLTVALHARRIADDEGRIVGYDGLVLDVTARRQAEEALRLHRDKLMHVSRLASLGEMLAAIVHEVGQPLHAISSFASASVNTVADSHDPVVGKVRYWNERIIQQATRAGAIIHRLRRLAHNGDLQPLPIDLGEVIAESVALVGPMLDKSRVEVCVEDDSDSLTVLADRVLIEQVLSNLLRNACEAMSGDDIERRLITLRTVRRTRFAEVTVEDTGSGLAGVDLREIFTAFVSTKRDGMGLGLAISKTIVEAHGGRVWAEPKETQGACLRFTLPLAQE